jgi:hypothetical protein
MADVKWAAFSLGIVAHISLVEAKDFAMIEIFFVYQLVRNPLQVTARHWWCVSLFRATRGRRRCAGCNGA